MLRRAAIRQCLDLPCEAGEPVFQPVEGCRIIARAAVAAAGGNRPGDLVETRVESCELLHDHALARVDMRTDMFKRGCDRDELLFKGSDGAGVAHAAKLRLDVIEPVGNANDLVTHRASVEPVEANLDIVPAALHATDGILAGKAVHQ